MVIKASLVRLWYLLSKDLSSLWLIVLTESTLVKLVGQLGNSHRYASRCEAQALWLSEAHYVPIAQMPRFFFSDKSTAMLKIPFKSDTST